MEMQAKPIRRTGKLIIQYIRYMYLLRQIRFIERKGFSVYNIDKHNADSMHRVYEP